MRRGQTGWNLSDSKHFEKAWAGWKKKHNFRAVRFCMATPRVVLSYIDVWTDSDRADVIDERRCVAGSHLSKLSSTTQTVVKLSSAQENQSSTRSSRQREWRWMHKRWQGTWVQICSPRSIARARIANRRGAGYNIMSRRVGLCCRRAIENRK